MKDLNLKSICFKDVELICVVNERFKSYKKLTPLGALPYRTLLTFFCFFLFRSHVSLWLSSVVNPLS